MKYEILGQRFGKLTTIGIAPKDKWKRSTYRCWICKCDCGNETIVRSTHLVKGDTISCGCALKRKCSEHPNWTGYEEISGNFFYSIKAHAVQRDLRFDITIKDAWDVFITQNRKCALTKLPLNFPTSGRNRDGTASLDRIDNSKGYTRENIQWLHKDINIMKMDFTTAEFINYCQLVIENSHHH